MLFFFMSSFNRSIHLSLGLPLGRDPSIWVFRKDFAMLSSSLRCTWPNHDSRFFIRKVFIGFMCTFSQMVTFLIHHFLTHYKCKFPQRFTSICLSCISFSLKFPCVLTITVPCFRWSIHLPTSVTRQNSRPPTWSIVCALAFNHVRGCVDQNCLRWPAKFSTPIFRDHPHGGTKKFDRCTCNKYYVYFISLRIMLYIQRFE